ncbi:MAG: type I methionyl aminopeptidase [Myxococcales bacterium]|nr:type I methionyl aminopeptidase [Myxococcales bacterium]
MAIERFAERDWGALRNAGRVASETLATVGARVQAGVSTGDIDRFVRTDTRARGGVPSQLGYHGFPAAVCTSVNDVVCHGIPSPHQLLSPGDIVNVDVTTHIGGFHGDTSRMFFVGTPGPEARHVVSVAERCLWAGIEQVRDGARLGDIGAAIEELAGQEGCSVVRDFGGHGIGRVMHAPPHVPHTGERGRGLRLRTGMAFTIEPMINLGSAEVIVEADGWTVRTLDGSMSAQFEHTILVTNDGCEVLTGPAGGGGQEGRR